MVCNRFVSEMIISASEEHFILLAKLLAESVQWLNRSTHDNVLIDLVEGRDFENYLSIEDKP